MSCRVIAASEATAATEATLEATATRTVWVPALWLLEVCHLLLSAQRRKRIGAHQRTALAAAASALRLQVDREPVAIQTLDALAAHHALTACDAVYLELALRRKLPLATFDKGLLAAMARAGVAPAV